VFFFFFFFFFNDTATTEIYTLSLHDAFRSDFDLDSDSLNYPNLTILATPRRSEEHTSELQLLAYLVCRLLLEKKKQQKIDREVSDELERTLGQVLRDE